MKPEKREALLDYLGRVHNAAHMHMIPMEQTVNQGASFEVYINVEDPLIINPDHVSRNISWVLYRIVR